MAYPVNPYALLSAAAVVVNLALGCIVFKKRPKHPLNRVFGSLIILVGVVWPFSEFMLRMTQDPNVAYFWARLAWTSVLLSPALVFHLVLTMTKKDWSYGDKLKVWVIYFISALFIVLNFTTNSVISGVTQEFWGYTGSLGRVFKNFFSVYFLMIVPSVFYLLYRRHKITRDSIEKIQIKYVSIGLFFPYVIGSLTQLFRPVLGYTPIPIASATTIVMDGLIAYAIIRYKLFSITPTTEDKADTKLKYRVDAKTYLIPAGDDDKAMDMYVDQIVHGRQGLCVTTTKPTEIKEKYKITKTPIIWLTDEEGGHHSIPPNDLEQLTLHLKDFARISAKNSIVLLDGVDYLIEVNGFTKVYGMIKELNEETSKTKTTLIVPIKNRGYMELIRLQLRKDDIEKEIFFAKKRFHKREIDEQSFREIVKDFEKELIELDLKMSKIEKKMSGEEMEIMG